MVLLLHSSGISAVLKITFNNRVSHSKPPLPAFFQNSTGISSGPVALPLLIFRITPSTSSTLTRLQYPIRLKLCSGPPLRRKITHISIFRIAKSCASLTSLRMESCMLVPRKAFVLIGQHCRYLDELDLTDSEIDDEGLKSISMCTNLSSLKLGICLNITDQGLIHVGMHCSNLKELDLYRSTGITDRGISAISHRCADLEIINIAYCNRITDHSFISLSKCSKLNTLESRGCPCVTSLGLAAVATGCKQLTKLDIKKCHNIGDAGMIPLARFSQNLKQINLSYTSVTDVGLLSLASIARLQNITVLHLKGLTPSGLGAALLACRGLAKIKLQILFK